MKEKNQISIRQLALLFIMITFSPAIRIFPQITAGAAKQAAWLSPFIAFIPMVFLVFLIQSFFRKNPECNLSEVIYKIMGNFLGRIVTAVYFVWLFILLILYLRYYVERMTASIFPNTSMQFFVITMVVFILFVLRDGAVPFARYNELLFLIFIAAFTGLLLLSIPNIQLRNLLPVSYKDIMPVTQGVYSILGIWGYYFFIFFFDVKINNKEKIKKFGIKASFFLTIVAVAIIATAVGSLGPNLVVRVNLPFIATIKIISVADTLERMESVVLSLWVIADFLVIVVFAYMVVSIIKGFFKLEDTKAIATPVVLLAYIFTFWFANNRFELTNFTKNVGLTVNVYLTFLVPLFLWVIGKIRKVI